MPTTAARRLQEQPPAPRSFAAFRRERPICADRGAPLPHAPSSSRTSLWS